MFKHTLKIIKLVNNKFYYKNKKIISNFNYLSILHFFKILIPLFIFPYLIRTIGVQKYGLIILAETVTMYFVAIINFGFDLSATKHVSINNKNNS